MAKSCGFTGSHFDGFCHRQRSGSAYKVIQQHQTLKLSLEDAEAFVEVLQNFPKPSDSLIAAALRYKQIIQKNCVND